MMSQQVDNFRTPLGSSWSKQSLDFFTSLFLVSLPLPNSNCVKGKEAEEISQEDTLTPPKKRHIEEDTALKEKVIEGLSPKNHFRRKVPPSQKRHHRQVSFFDDDLSSLLLKSDLQTPLNLAPKNNCKNIPTDIIHMKSRARSKPNCINADRFNSITRVPANNAHANIENGTYLPICNIFEKLDIMNSVIGSNNQCISFEGWLAFSTKRRIIDKLRNGSSLSRTDIRYVIIKGSSMYVFTSNTTKKSNHKVLTLSEDMKVTMKFLSKKHGFCVTIKYITNLKLVCTLLPIQIYPEMFRDKDYSQVISEKKFEKLKKSIFTTTSWEPSALKHCSVEYNDRREMPEHISEKATIEQHTACLHTMFALNCALNTSGLEPS